MSSRDLYTVLGSNEAVALFLLLPLLPHIIHHSLTVDLPDSLINLKQRTDRNKNPPKWDKSSRWEVSTPVLCHCGTFFFLCALTGGGGNLLWGAQNEVHCSHKIICLALASSCVCGVLKVWSERAEWGGSLRSGYKNVMVKVVYAPIFGCGF